MSISTILLLLLGVTLVVAGSNYLVEGASDIARRSGISEFVIGLAIVGIGTSTPEMVVSFIGALQGNADISVGNVLGSNICNTCLILGLTAVILPIGLTRENIQRDIPLNIAVTILFILMGMNKTIFGYGSNEISRLDGVIMLSLFALYMYSCFKSSSTQSSQSEDKQKAGTYKNALIPTLMVIGGTLALIFGGRLFVNNSITLAHHFGLSDKFIGITLLAMGTSLPELVTCVIAAAKKKGQLALGNIIGSNIANILLIMGGASLIHPLTFTNFTPVDLGFVLLSALYLLLAYFTFGKKSLGRLEGMILLVMEAGYLSLLYINN